MFSIKCVNYVSAICVSSLINMLAVKCVKDISTIGISPFVKVFTVPSVHNVTTICVSSLINMFAVKCVKDVSTVRVFPFVKVFTIPSVHNITAIGIASRINVYCQFVIFLNYILLLWIFRIIAVFKVVFLTPHFLFSFRMGCQPVGFRRPSCFFNLPITVCSYKKLAISETKTVCQH